MKGLVLRKGDRIVCGGSDSGVVSVLIHNKEFRYCLNFGGVDADGRACTWCFESLAPGERLSVSYEEFDTASEPVRLGDGKNTAEDDLALLREYERLKKELTEEGR